MRHLLLPALRGAAVAAWAGSAKAALGYVCDRLNVPPADAWGVATFYALLFDVAAPPGGSCTSATTSPASAAARTN